MAEEVQPSAVQESADSAEQQAVVQGSPEEVVAELIKNKVGIGLFKPEDLPQIDKALAEAGFELTGRPPGVSQMGGGDTGRAGTLHRHGDGAIIVHQTLEGSGPANFYWPKRDLGGFEDNFEFNPDEDEVVASATGIVINPDIVVVFPSSTWHQFGADPHSDRHSEFRTFYPVNNT